MPDNVRFPQLARDYLDEELVLRFRNDSRESWRKAASALEVEPVTVRRRWQRLEQAQEAWTTAALGSRSAFGIIFEMTPAPHEYDQLIHELNHEPETIMVGAATGTSTVFAISMFASWGAAQHHMLQIQKACSVSPLNVRYFTGPIAGVGGPQGVLDLPRQLSRSDTASTGTRRPLDSRDSELIRQLSIDARIDFESLGKSFGVSASTAQRRVTKLMNRAELVLFADSTYMSSSTERELWIEFSVSSPDSLYTVDQIARWEEVQFVAPVSGITNIFTILKAGSEHKAEQIIERIEEQFALPGTMNTRMILKYAKRYTRVFDHEGKVDEIVPFKLLFA